MSSDHDSVEVTLRTPSRRVAWIALALLAVVTAVAMWRLAEERAEPPRVLGSWIGGFEFEAFPESGKPSTAHIGLMSRYAGEEDPETLTFRSAEAHLARNTAGAVATFFVCRPRIGLTGIGGGAVLHASSPAEFCRDARPVRPGTTLAWGTESTAGEILVLSVRPTRPGVAEIDSVTLDYARDEDHGGNSGVERIDGLEFVVHTD